MGSTPPQPGSATLQLVNGVALLRPDEQVFAAMLRGWRNQQLARNLAFGTIERRENVVRAFAAYINAFPWVWTPQVLDEWLGDLHAVRGLRRSTLRNYQTSVQLFCDCMTDPAYGWAAECERLFGTHPVEIVHDWNTAAHVQDAEGDPRKRALTVVELQDFFDAADDRVASIRARGRKGWLPAFRDAVVFKVAYGYGTGPVGEYVAVGGEVGQECGLAKLGAGVDVAVGPDRCALRDGAQVPQDVPGAELAQGLLVVGVGDAVQPRRQPLLEQEQEAVDRRKDAAADEQVADRR